MRTKATLLTTPGSTLSSWVKAIFPRREAAAHFGAVVRNVSSSSWRRRRKNTSRQDRPRITSELSRIRLAPLWRVGLKLWNRIVRHQNRTHRLMAQSVGRVVFMCDPYRLTSQSASEQRHSSLSHSATNESWNERWTGGNVQPPHCEGWVRRPRPGVIQRGRIASLWSYWPMRPEARGPILFIPGDSGV